MDGCGGSNHTLEVEIHLGSKRLNDQCADPNPLLKGRPDASLLQCLAFDNPLDSKELVLLSSTMLICISRWDHRLKIDRSIGYGTERC